VIYSFHYEGQKNNLSGNLITAERFSIFRRMAAFYAWVLFPFFFIAIQSQKLSNQWICVCF